MTRLISQSQYSSKNYAVIDLGSNSFHLQITQLVDNNIEIINKVKRKVRLANGLNSNNELSSESIARGLDCLSLFSKHLVNIPKEHIRIVATATLRIAANSSVFVSAANKILPVNINILSGEQEANIIYSGASHTCHDKSTQKRLIIDIGGASTELIIGTGYTAQHAISLNIGCVSFNDHYFGDTKLTAINFDRAIAAADKIISPIAVDFITLGWQVVLGSSGTLQALAEILRYRQQEIVISAKFLQEIKHSLLAYKTISNIDFSGLRADRNPVLASGLCILIALFNCLKIKELNLSTGALREGLLFEMQAKSL